MKAINTVVIAGAGTMGQGIAQVCLAAGFKTTIYDSNPAALERASNAIFSQWENLIQKEKLTVHERDVMLSLMSVTADQSTLRADLIIEAIIEEADPKINFFKAVESINDESTIYASNTSSLSISYIAENLKRPGNFLGIHFFNPAPRMKLVEVIRGKQTDAATMERASAFLVKANKVIVSSADHPGFIVNRVARPFYLESLRALERGSADIEGMDDLLRSSGFKMGPFELMDLIGIDINYAVSYRVYEGFERASRFEPSQLQAEKVSQGKLGRKTGEGFYKYDQKKGG